MRVIVEPSGCVVVPEKAERRQREGCWAQVMYRFYPESGDPGFEEYEAKHHVHVPVDWSHYEQWRESLPKDENGNYIYPNPNDIYDYPGERHWVYNPLVHHAVWLEPDVTDAAILDIGEALGKLYAEQLANRESPDLPSQRLRRTVATPQRLAACEAKRAHLEATPLERKIAKAKVAR